ncbi:hypothetical protein NW755_000659 [Fusarium falciforme]|uniref:Uncharacterized protein n=1 Tax=Fusarium falciforme TaxID=195108 RepID=A0A9W8RKA3_9HYPO|nr:hypothetical protein NW755_000659 [Fusarium falciforme]KAJ4262180.1 hypothetical protein NW757_000446 [Fusarium falciforme]
MSRNTFLTIAAVTLVTTLATVIDTEKGEETPRVSKFDKLKGLLPVKKLLISFVLLVCLLAVMFGMGVLASHYTQQEIRAYDGALMAEAKVHGDGHVVVRRDGGDGDGTVYPISTMTETKTELSTIYATSRAPNVFTKVETVTGTTYVTVPEEVHVSISVATIESSTEVCEIEVVTMTESFTVTVIPIPSEDFTATSAALPEATVIGKPSTVTDVQTQLSFTSGLPDATVSGSPDTVTNVETDFSVSPGLPDATVSGNPSTVTDVQTNWSLTSGLPDATVSGEPFTVTQVDASFSVTGSFHTVITVTDLFPPAEDMSTVTELTTVQKTLTTHKSIVTITVTDLVQESPVVSFISPTSTFTKVVFETTGEAPTSTKTVQVQMPPYPTANNTMVVGPSGTVTVIPTVVTPIIVSGATKKPEPRGFGGSNGTSNLGCAIMLIATIMFFL